MLQTAYREIDFDDERMARQQRDAHLAELQAQGMDCVAEDLYNALEGWWVFTLVATSSINLEESDRAHPSTSSRSRIRERPKSSERPKQRGSVPRKPSPKQIKFTYDVL